MDTLDQGWLHGQLCSHTGPCAQASCLGLAGLWLLNLEILTHFVLEFVLCKSSPMGQWHVRWGLKASGKHLSATSQSFLLSPGRVSVVCSPVSWHLQPPSSPLLSITAPLCPGLKGECLCVVALRQGLSVHTGGWGPGVCPSVS